MKIFQKLSHFFCITLLFMLNACEKQDVDNLKSKFSCSISGEELIPKKIGSPFLIVSLQRENKNYYSHFSIYVLNNSKRYKELRLTINTMENPIQVGQYSLGEIDFNNLGNSKHAECYFEKSGDNKINLVYESLFKTKDEINGMVYITKIDTIAKNVQGTFQFEAINKFNEKIIVNNGKFNVTDFDR